MPNSAWVSRVPNAVLHRARPPRREPHRLCGARLVRRPGHALVELHDDVGAEPIGLDLDRAFGRQHVARAVDRAGESRRLLCDLGQLRQRHDLEAAGIGQDGPAPAAEAVQAAQTLHPLRAGPQHQVHGVAEDDVRAGGGDLVHGHGLDRRRGADRHEGGRSDVAARGAQHAGARGAVPGVDIEREGGHASARHNRLASP